MEVHFIEDHGGRVLVMREFLETPERYVDFRGDEGSLEVAFVDGGHNEGGEQPHANQNAAQTKPLRQT